MLAMGTLTYAQQDTPQRLPVTAIDSVSGLRQIETDLVDGVDFRQLQWRACFNANQCRIEGIDIRAEARRSNNADWEPARLYWDPIDGIGIIGNGQDDEIDFNERLLVTLNTNNALEGIWFSDIFVGEIQRYLGLDKQLVGDEDFEVARFTLEDNSGTLYQVDLDGLTPLPPESFNSLLDKDTFFDDGDIHTRLIINGPTVALELPTIDEEGQRSLIDFRLGEVEAGKLSLFEDDNEFEYDLDEVFANGEALRALTEMKHNANEVEGKLRDVNALMAWNKAAVDGRKAGVTSNGEVGAFFAQSLVARQITFTAPAGTSNDYSILGLVWDAQ